MERGRRRHRARWQGSAKANLISCRKQFWRVSSEANLYLSFSEEDGGEESKPDEGHAKKPQPEGNNIPRGNKWSPPQASADKAKGKNYAFWALNFLQRACAYRGPPLISQEKNKQVLVYALTAQDETMERFTLFFDDLQAIPDRKVVNLFNLCHDIWADSGATIEGAVLRMRREGRTRIRSHAISTFTTVTFSVDRLVVESFFPVPPFFTLSRICVNS